jgi:hypothetical protein
MTSNTNASGGRQKIATAGWWPSRRNSATANGADVAHARARLSHGAVPPTAGSPTTDGCRIVATAFTRRRLRARVAGAVVAVENASVTATRRRIVAVAWSHRLAEARAALEAAAVAHEEATGALRPGMALLENVN